MPWLARQLSSRIVEGTRHKIRAHFHAHVHDIVAIEVESISVFKLIFLLVSFLLYVNNGVAKRQNLVKVEGNLNQGREGRPFCNEPPRFLPFRC